ncbi:hypothetical protein OUZ56_019864 [Daphnia magna]|uniref:Apple domain-containing protein n=1 Tax=Daphnia magna TaxID=35525 RepID=A0ABQ9ZCV1_9CRUS|nr:hypothetical protein OUZ56_019864 [Daphnia magna]
MQRLLQHRRKMRKSSCILFCQQMRQYTHLNTIEETAEMKNEACWELIVDGRRLDPQFIVRSVWAATLLDCQRECEDVLFNCETIAYGKNLLKNTTCDLSDWEAASLSVQPYATDTIVAPTFNVYSRYGRYPNEALDERRCNSFDDPAHHDTTPYYRPASTQIETLSEDGEFSNRKVFDFYDV